MALVEMRAKFRCDGCGRLFSVEVDPAMAVSDCSAFDVAEDAVRGSIRYEGPRGVDGLQSASSVQDDQHLCGPCTSVVDEAEEDDDDDDREAIAPGDYRYCRRPGEGGPG